MRVCARAHICPAPWWSRIPGMQRNACSGLAASSYCKQVSSALCTANITHGLHFHIKESAGVCTQPHTHTNTDTFPFSRPNSTQHTAKSPGYYNINQPVKCSADSGSSGLRPAWIPGIRVDSAYSMEVRIGVTGEQQGLTCVTIIILSIRSNRLII